MALFTPCLLMLLQGTWLSCARLHCYITEHKRNPCHISYCKVRETLLTSTCAPLASSKAPGPGCPSHPQLLEELVGQQGPQHQHLTTLPASQTPAHHIAFTRSSPHLFPFTIISDLEVLLKAILKKSARRAVLLKLAMECEFTSV